jgi:hypothetical protein
LQVGLPLSVLYLMKPALAELARAVPPARVLGLAYPDVMDDRSQLCAVFGEAIRERLVSRTDARQALARHGLPDADVIETGSLFAALGLELECIDVQEGPGIDRVADLNEPLPADLVGRYGMVIDPGTIEHCFNIGQAMMNAARAVAVGGFAVHVNPLSMFNHGFYNINPTFYHDFYGDNGFRVRFMSGLAPTAGPGAFFDVPPVARFSGAPENGVMIVIAQRLVERPLVWPVQTKYRGAISAPGFPVSLESPGPVGDNPAKTR